MFFVPIRAITFGIIQCVESKEELKLKSFSMNEKHVEQLSLRFKIKKLRPKKAKIFL